MVAGPPYQVGSPWDRIVNVHWRKKAPLSYGTFTAFNGGFTGFNLPPQLAGPIQFLAATNVFAAGYTETLSWTQDTSPTGVFPPPPGYIIGGQPATPPTINFGEWVIVGTNLDLGPDGSKFYRAPGNSCTAVIPINGHAISDGGKIGSWGDTGQGQVIGGAGGIFAGGAILTPTRLDDLFYLTVTCSGLSLTVDGVRWTPYETQIAATTNVITNVTPRISMGTTFIPPNQKTPAG